MRLETHMLATYQRLRRALYLTAFALPFVLWVWGGPLRESISAYYDDADWGRKVFVGTLFAVGLGLLSYKGFTPSEDNALNLSGLMAFGVAWFPHGGALPFHATLHGICAVLFFLGIAYVCIFHAKDTLSFTGKRWMVNTYRVFGGLMVAVPLSIWFVGASNRTFWAESVAIWVFGGYWWLKTDELQRIDRTGSLSTAQGAGA